MSVALTGVKGLITNLFISANLCTFQALPVCSISPDHPFIEPSDIVDAQAKLGVDCKAALLCGIPLITC